MVLSRLTKITGPGIRTDTNWVGNNSNYTGILTAATLGDVGNLNITGIITATTFAGTLQTAAQPNITSVGTLSSLNVSGSVSIGGTLTYEDVTNIDSVGIVTARSGIKVGTGVTIEPNGQATFTGIVTFGSGSTTIDNNVVNVGTALTLGHTQGLQFHTQNLHSQGFEVNQINASGIITAASFSGTASGNTTISNNADNRVITGGSGNALNGEPGLTFDGTTFANLGSGYKEIKINPSTNNSATLRLQNSQANYTISNITGGSFSIADGSDTRLTINSSGTVGVNNDLDVDGHTNLDNVSIAGVSTFNDDVTFDSALSGREMVWDKSDNALEFGSYAQIKLEDQASIRFGTDEDMILWHNGAHANIKNTTGRLYILADDIYIKDGDDGDIHARFLHDDKCELRFDNDIKLETTNTGVTVTGTVAATAFTGDGSNLTGLASREFYGFVGVGNSLSLTTTNSGADNIDGATYAAFEESFVGPSGISFSINTSGNLIMTV